MESKKVDKVFTHLRNTFGENPRCELNYTHPHELLIAIILSAQCTDKRVNMVTPTLFARYKSVKDFANADQADVEKIIHSCGFYHNKATSIIKLCNELLALPEIPKTVEELSKLSGLGRKSASVFLAEQYGIPALAVDTHVIRLSNRFEFTTSRDPIKIERDLKKLFDEKNWGAYSFYMVLFGRYHCTAKNPKCAECALKGECNVPR